jgi:hypothetical protein
MAVVLLLSVACDGTPGPLSPDIRPGFVAGGNTNNQRAEGHAVALAGFHEYTFAAMEKKGQLTGHIEGIVSPPTNYTFTGDVICMTIVPGTTTAYLVAILTSSTVPGAGAFSWVSWTVTDGGHGSKAASDAASFLNFATFDPDAACAAGIPAEETNDQTDVTVKP